MKTRVFAYIDGWNFQVCASRLRKPHLLWVSLPKLCQRFINDEKEVLSRVYLFTALSAKFPTSSQICGGQLDYQRSVGVNVIEGYFGKLRIRDKLGDKKIILKEKESDVSLSIAIVEDSILGMCDKVILVSNDGDFAPALKKVKSYGGEVEVIIPPTVSVNKKLCESNAQKSARQISEQDLELSAISR